MEQIKIAIIGFGGIARVHNRAYSLLKSDGYAVKLVAICEKNPERVTNTLNFNLGVDNTPLPEDIRIYSDVDEMINTEEFDVADICLPSFLHKDMTVKLLRAGKHVLCEKPMALSSADCEEMLAAEKESGKNLMIGQCVRFDPAYVFLRDAIRSGSFGELDNLYLDRHSVYPTWGADKIFDSTEKCGGCTMDTHIHDVDIARFLLGNPESVSAVAFDNAPVYQVITSTLFYKGPTVIINGSWDAAREKAFEVGYRARFKDAALIFDGKSVKVVPNGKEGYIADIGEKDYMVEEIRFFLDLVKDGTINTYNPADSAAESVRLVETLRRSASSSGERIAL